MIIYFIVLAIFLTMLIISKDCDISQVPSKSMLLLPFYKISGFILFQAGAKHKQKIFFKDQVAADLRILYPSGRKEDRFYLYYSEKIALMLFVLFVGNIAAIFTVWSQSGDQALIDGKYIDRGGYESGPLSQELLVTVKDEFEKMPFEVPVNARKYNKDELQVVFQEAMKKLDNIILGQNDSLDEVRHDLKLVSSIPEYPFQIEWVPDNFEVLSSTGQIQTEKTNKNGTLVCVRGILKYEEESADYMFYANILPPLRSGQEQLLWDIREAVRNRDADMKTKPKLELPGLVNGKAVTWSQKQIHTGILILLLSISAAIFIFAGKDKELHDQVILRDRQMLLDYPEIVCKLTLLLGAGMTVKGAFSKIALDYRSKAAEKSRYKRYAYEEILIAYYEMQNGKSELDAYDNFGRRCKVQRYLKMSTLLTQNLRKGSKGMLQIFSLETADAFEERKAMARRMGEEAGTKLLLPMFLMLGIVLMILVVPACLSFQL